MNWFNKSWFSFIRAKLMPIIHFINITMDRVILLYTIIIANSIDVGQVFREFDMHCI